MAENNKPFENFRYYAIATDPIHIGTGGYRLARVDNTIVREPATNLPKIPGSGISGVCRAYSALAYNKYLYSRDGKLYSCAGKGGEGGEQHCGKYDCPICTTFGFSKGPKQSFQGLAQFFDAKIIFFPVHSMIGPVWITCASVLKDVLITELSNCPREKFAPIYHDYLNTVLNFGWLLLQKNSRQNVTFNMPEEVQSKLSAIRNRLFQVEDGIFSELVNTNLEVRTSVAIDPATGAADPGALFTYEAIPAGTVFAFDIVINNPQNFLIYAAQDGKLEPKQIEHNKTLATINSTKTIVDKGLEFIKDLGLGGMGTRGFGRMKVLNFSERKITNDKEKK